MADRLFGTDGVRGVAGAYPLDPPTVCRLGAALVRTLGADRPARLIIAVTSLIGRVASPQLARAPSVGASVTTGRQSHGPGRVSRRARPSTTSSSSVGVANPYTTTAQGVFRRREKFGEPKERAVGLWWLTRRRAAARQSR